MRILRDIVISKLGTRRTLLQYGLSIAALQAAAAAIPAITGGGKAAAPPAATGKSRKRAACADGRDRCNGRCCRTGQSCDWTGNNSRPSCTRAITCPAGQAECSGLCCEEGQICVRVRGNRSFCAASNCAQDPCSCCTEGQECRFSAYFNMSYCADPDCDPCKCMPWGAVC